MLCHEKTEKETKRVIFFIVHVHFYEAQEKSAKAAQTRSPTAPMHLYTQRYTQWVYIHIRTKILLFYFINIIHTPVQHRSWKWLPFERLVICMYRCTYWWWDDGGFYFYVSLYFILLCVVVVFISLYIVAFCECTILIFLSCKDPCKTHCRTKYNFYVILGLEKMTWKKYENFSKAVISEVYEDPAGFSVA